MNILNIIKIITFLSGINLLYFLFTTDQKIQLFFIKVETPFEFFNYYINQGVNFAPILLLTLFFTILFIFVLFSTSLVFNISYIIISVIIYSIISTSLYDLKYKSGILIKNKYFSLERVLIPEEKQQWLENKISQYEPGNKFEPSKQWILNHINDVEYKSFEDLNIKFSELIKNYAESEKIKQMVENKTNLIIDCKSKKTGDYIEDVFTWMWDHPKTITTIVLVGIGVYIYHRFSLSESFKEYHEHQKEWNKNHEMFESETQNSLAYLNENISNNLNHTITSCSSLNNRITKEINTLNVKVDSYEKIFYKSYESFRDFLVKSTLKSTEEINKNTEVVNNLSSRVSDCESLVSSVSSNIPNPNIPNIFEKIAELSKESDLSNTQLNLIAQKVDSFDSLIFSLQSELMSRLLEKMPSQLSFVLQDQNVITLMNTQVDLACQAWLSKNPSLLEAIMINTNKIAVLNSNLHNLSEAVTIALQILNQMQQNSIPVVDITSII